jgi:hypothetical protein
MNSDVGTSLADMTNGPLRDDEFDHEEMGIMRKKESAVKFYQNYIYHAQKDQLSTIR